MKSFGELCSEEGETVKLIELYSGKKAKLTKQGQCMDFASFKKQHQWDMKKLYIIETQKLKENAIVRQKLILWRKGIIEVPSKQHMIAKSFGKVIVDERSIILGNSQIVIKGDDIKSFKAVNNYYSGNLGEQAWKIKKVSIYNFV